MVSRASDGEVDAVVLVRLLVELWTIRCAVEAAGMWAAAVAAEAVLCIHVFERCDMMQLLLDASGEEGDPGRMDVMRLRRNKLLVFARARHGC